jgi:helicase
MTESLTRWMGTADAIRHVEHFRIAQVPLGMGYIRDRVDDYYTALLLDSLRSHLQSA